MSAESILAKIGLKASDVARIAAKNRPRPSIADQNEAKYNPKGEDDSVEDVIDDAKREATAFATANFGLVSNSRWEMNTRIGG